MTFITSGLFWFIIGILFCVTLIGLKIWMEDRGVRMIWWKWGFAVIWIVFAGFTIAFTGVSIGENEMTAAWMGALVFGLAVILSGIIIWRVLHIGEAK